MKRRRTVTAKYAQSLHTAIRGNLQHMDVLNRENQHLLDALQLSRAEVEGLKRAADDLAAKVDKMGKDLGCANRREMATRHVAEVALNALGTLGHTMKMAPIGQVVSTAFSLERDGRTQLAKVQEQESAR